MSRNFTLLLLALLSVFFLSCGNGTDAGGGLRQSQSTNRANLLPGQTVYGRVRLLPFMPIVTPSAQTIFRELRASLQPGPVRISQAGDYILWPDSPGSNWILKLGAQTVFADETGAFQVTVPVDGLIQATLCDSEGKFEPIALSLSDLSLDPQHSKELIVPIGFKGSCGMSPEDTDEFCAPGTLDPIRTAQFLARFFPVDWQSETPKKPGVIRTERGTYPPPVLLGGCPDTDGPLQLSNNPDNDEKIELIQRTPRDLIQYLESTCDQNVLDGACVNENAFSNIEYRRLQAFLNNGVVQRLESALGAQFSGNALFLTPASAVGGNTRNCVVNHKSRICGTFLLGDVSVDTSQGLVPTGESQTLMVEPGQEGTFVVHNNGAFGQTFITDIEGDAVELDPTPVSEAGGTAPNMERLGFVLTLLHYDERPVAAYRADRTIRFRVNANAREGEESFLVFRVDDRKVELKFKVTRAVVKITPPQATLARGTSQTFTASLENPPQTGQISYEWSLDRRAGTLSSSTGESVRFLASGGDVVSLREEILVNAVLETAAGRRVVGRGSATISIEGSLVQVAPSSVNLPLTQDTPTTFSFSGPAVQELSSILQDTQPNGVTATAIFRWSVSGTAGGTLSVTDSNGQAQQGVSLETTSPSVQYLKKANAQNGQEDTVKLEVLIRRGANTDPFGTASASVNIGTRLRARIVPLNAQISGTTDSVDLTVVVEGGAPGDRFFKRWRYTTQFSLGSLVDAQGRDVAAGTELSTVTYKLSRHPNAAPQTDGLEVEVYTVNANGTRGELIDTLPTTVTVQVAPCTPNGTVVRNGCNLDTSVSSARLGEVITINFTEATGIAFPPCGGTWTVSTTMPGQWVTFSGGTVIGVGTGRSGSRVNFPPVDTQTPRTLTFRLSANPDEYFNRSLCPQPIGSSSEGPYVYIENGNAVDAIPYTVTP